jgi:hypothetical protein
MLRINSWFTNSTDYYPEVEIRHFLSKEMSFLIWVDLMKNIA